MLGEALETYTRLRPREVLLVRVEINGLSEEVLVFRGASSSLTSPTPVDPGQPVIPPGARLLNVDRLKAPYLPNDPQVIATGLDQDQLERLLAEENIVL